MIRLMAPSAHDRSEWARMSKAAYSFGHIATGNRFKAAAARDGDMPLARFDSLQRDYRAWLCFNEYPEGDTFAGATLA